MKFILKKFPLDKALFKSAIYFIILILFPLIHWENSQATLYKWKDEQGNIHFSSDPDTIPEQYKTQSKELNPGPAPEFSPPPLTAPESPPAPNLDIVVPMRQNGNQFFVKTILNGRLEANLLLDTGASVIVVSEEIAKSLGFSRLDNMPQIQADTAGGKIWTPLIFLDTAEVAGAKAFAIEAVIDSKLGKIDGLLGMEFFEQFKMTLDRKKSRLILRSNISENETLYEDRPVSWWIKKIKHFRSNKVYFERLSEKLAMENHEKAYNVEKTAKHYGELLNRVRSSAQALQVPLD